MNHCSRLKDIHYRILRGELSRNNQSPEKYIRIDRSHDDLLPVFNRLGIVAALMWKFISLSKESLILLL